MVYRRQGEAGDPHSHHLLKETVFHPGKVIARVTNLNPGARFPKGMFAAMSDGKILEHHLKNK